ncbi:MAG TPA: class I SAM-dependent methyltransferase [Trebonia sp.]|nr:class I SAM-dependent methyltransferase [Trebonia sp.]
MRLALRGANPAERLALRTGLVPVAAADAWGGMALSGIVVAAVRTGITARLAAGHATAAELAAELGLDPLPTRLLLDCLRSAGHVTERSGRYRLSRSARRWLDPASPLSVATYVAGVSDYWPWWSGLDETVRTGKTSSSHEAGPDDPYWHRYIAGQRELARLSAAEVAKKIPLPARPRALLDIGGGHGWYAAALCQRHPTLRATVLDLPGSAAVGRELIAAAGLSDRVGFREGDATTADLAADIDGGYDAVLCFNLVHHLAPEAAAALFRRASAALKPGGTLAVLDVFAEPGRRASAHADLLALFVYLSSGARVHTPRELGEWLHEAGFAPPKKVRILRIPGLTLQVTTKSQQRR